MTLRNTVLGVAAVFGLSVWSWSRATEAEAHPPAAEVRAAETAGAGGNYDEAVVRFRTNQARHWRQVALAR